MVGSDSGLGHSRKYKITLRKTKFEKQKLVRNHAISFLFFWSSGFGLMTLSLKLWWYKKLFLGGEGIFINRLKHYFDVFELIILPLKNKICMSGQSLILTDRITQCFPTFVSLGCPL